MFDKVSKILFVVLFIFTLAVPIVTTNLRQDKISVSEKRKLVPMAKLYDENGAINKNFLSDFEKWINDNIGLRSQMVALNAEIQYYMFNTLADNGNMRLGPNGELNYVTKPIVRDYQHVYLYSKDKIKCITDSFQEVSDYLSDRNIQFYYFQCWDKQSIYPEQFPNTINQYGEKSKTEQLVENLEKNTTINVVSPKQELIDAKKEYNTYGTWYDPTHWTQRGAYIGYKKLMNEINKNNSYKYKVLQEKDYDIFITDQGSTVFGNIHKPDYEEELIIHNPKAYAIDVEPIFLSEWADNSRKILVNDAVDNNDTLLILGDSYFDGFLYDDFAESFHMVIQIWGDYTSKIQEIVDYYNPSIVVCENAERCDRTEEMVKAAQAIKEE